MLNPVELLNFFFKLLTSARIILHMISFPQFLYDLFHILYNIDIMLMMYYTGLASILVIR